jgi:hypothetical protein
MSSDKPDLKLVPAPAPQAAGATPPGPPTLPPVPKGVPPWAYVILVALFVVAALLGRQIAPPVEPKPAEPQYVPVIVPMQPSGPQVSQGTAPEMVSGGPLARIRERLLLRSAREGAVNRLTSDGFAVVGRNAKPLTEARARELVAQVEDDVLLRHVSEKYGQSAVGEGGRLEAFLSWIWENREAIIKFLLSILALFALEAQG